MNSPKKPIVTFRDNSYCTCTCYLAHRWNDGIKERVILIIIPKEIDKQPFAFRCDFSQLNDYCRYR